MINSLLNADEKELKIRQIADRLLQADRYAEAFTTETQEEYDLLFDAAGSGLLPENFNLGRSGLWLNKKRVHPPTAVAVH
jgi:hypothetical protein